MTDDRTALAADVDHVPAGLLVDVSVVPDLYGPASAPLAADQLADLDDPGLVLSEGYIGPDRRRNGLWSWLYRATFARRRSLFSLEVAVVAAVATLAAAALVTSGLRQGSPGRSVAASTTVARAAATRATTTPVVGAAPAAALTTPTTVPPTSTPSTTVAAPAPPAATPAAPPTAAPASATEAAAPASASPTPEQLGAEALTLVRYPWQSIPGYTIQFLPVADAPGAGFYGNTTFTWGHTGGTSTLYVYPGETVQRLAGIIGFEIAHEVDAAAVDPQGGETQIENVLGIHPDSWAPDCDCAEQGFLSGWYAAAFSNYWSPGVGDWATVAPEPTGAVLAAIEPWLNPTIS